ncbi:hypothetical protein JP75_01260 [Devosia riboflavina]|uniref:Uncharacterized protein n=1 Tax=Devosia riboflavina TaxID=46914 RepID=A0A087M7F1_9HYPH|nr:hypothetical protein JP75_01260 [Devosia riboflavina]
MDSPIGNVRKGNSARSQHGASAQRHARTDNGPGPDPGIGPYRYGPRHDRKIRRIDIVVAGDEMGILGDDGIASQMDRGLAIDHRLPTDNRAVLKREKRRIPDFGAGIDAHAAPHSGAEKAQNGAAPAM